MSLVESGGASAARARDAATTTSTAGTCPQRGSFLYSFRFGNDLLESSNALVAVSVTAFRRRLSRDRHTASRDSSPATLLGKPQRNARGSADVGEHRLRVLRRGLGGGRHEHAPHLQCIDQGPLSFPIQYGNFTQPVTLRAKPRARPRRTSPRRPWLPPAPPPICDSR